MQLYRGHRHGGSGGEGRTLPWVVDGGSVKKRPPHDKHVNCYLFKYQVLYNRLFIIIYFFLCACVWFLRLSAPQTVVD